MDEITRRRFLESTAALSAVACLGRCAFSVNPVPSVTGPAADLAGRIQFSLSTVPDLAKAGGAVTMQSAGFDQPVLLMHIADGSFAGVSAICTHLGCTVTFRDDKQIVECPCHGGRFSIAGQVLRAPPTSPLVSYAVTTVGDQITIDSRVKFYPGVVDGSITLKPANISELDAAGGQLTYYAAGLNGPITVLAVTTSTFAALAGTCTFGDCLLTFDGTNLNCPCHGCAFALDGTVKHGPATVPLQAYTTSYDGTSLVIAV